MIKFSGLGERVAYWILVKLTRSELSANYATSLANTVLSLMIPSNTARGAVMSPICDNICEGMGYKRGDHKGDAAIMLSNLYTNTTNTWLFYTAVGANAIGMALVEEVTGQSISWTGWLKATCIPAGIIVLIIPLLTHFLFSGKKGEKRDVNIAFAKKKLEAMGPLRREGKKGGAVLCAHPSGFLHQRNTPYRARLHCFCHDLPPALPRHRRVLFQGRRPEFCLARIYTARLCHVSGHLRQQDRRLPVAG